MGKLFTLKEWITVADAVGHLSIVFGEEVTEADVLRLVLDGRLKLSIYFVNPAAAKRAHAISLNSPSEVMTRGTVEGQKRPFSLVVGMALGECLLEVCDDEISFLDGVYDLVMLGKERIEVAQRFQSLIGGPDVHDPFPDGPFVATEDGHLFQLQEQWQYPSQYEEAYEENSVHYRPAPKLPFDAAHLVFRTRALLDLEESINPASDPTDKPLTPKERNTLLMIIAALCKKLNIDHQGRHAVSRIVNMVESADLQLSDDTIRTVLGKLPGVLEARKRDS